MYVITSYHTHLALHEVVCSGQSPDAQEIRKFKVAEKEQREKNSPNDDSFLILYHKSILPAISFTCYWFVVTHTPLR